MLVIFTACGPNVSTVKKSKSKSSTQNVIQSNGNNSSQSNSSQSNQSSERFVTLNYNGPLDDPAASCTVNGEANLTVTTSCTCEQGICCEVILFDFLIFILS
ncbi:hypothetical protein N9N67_08760 [Bacteriovoracaceae bacterium]|nr:hypothetical protein [Bacteriovoracaceae bacterium]